ncbi:MAG: ATPase, partial [Chloroflexota bacterium]
EGDDGKTITSVTFEENAGKTLLVVNDLYPSTEALDSGSTGALPETLDQLDELLISLGSSTETK